MSLLWTSCGLVLELSCPSYPLHPKNWSWLEGKHGHLCKDGWALETEKVLHSLLIWREDRSPVGCVSHAAGPEWSADYQWLGLTIVLLEGGPLEANEAWAPFGICSKTWYLLLLRVTEKKKKHLILDLLLFSVRFEGYKPL